MGPGSTWTASVESTSDTRPELGVGDERAGAADRLDAARVGRRLRAGGRCGRVGSSTATMLDSRSAVTSASGDAAGRPRRTPAEPRRGRAARRRQRGTLVGPCPEYGCAGRRGPGTSDAPLRCRGGNTRRRPTMLRLIAFALVPLALASGTAAAGGGPSPGSDDRLGRHGGRRASAVRYVAMPAATTTDRRRRADERRPRAPLRDDQGRASAFRSSRSTARPRASRATARTLVLADFGASRQQTRFAVLSTATLRLQEGRDASGPLGASTRSRPTAARSTRSSTWAPGRTRATTSARSASSPASRSAARSSTSASRTRR